MKNDLEQNNVIDGRQLDKLDGVLLSANVCDLFEELYATDESFHKWLVELLPETDACFAQEQRTKWHIYNVMEHILHSVEAMNAQTLQLPQRNRRLLAYTMFLHDVGKPQCHTVKTEGGVMSDSFLRHNLASEQVAQRVLPFFGFNEKDRWTIAELVREHDVFLLLKETPTKPWHIKLSKEFLKEFIARLDRYGEGKRNFDYLLAVGIADNKAQNPELTAEPLALIEHIRSLAEEI